MLKTPMTSMALGLTLALNVHASDKNIATSLETALPDEAYQLIDTQVRTIEYNLDELKSRQIARQHAHQKNKPFLSKNQLDTGLTVKSVSQNLAEFTFTDANLGVCINEKAAQYGWLTVADVVELKCEGRQISSIADLSVFTNLQVISMTNNDISDLSPVANLPYVSHFDMAQ